MHGEDIGGADVVVGDHPPDAVIVEQARRGGLEVHAEGNGHQRGVVPVEGVRGPDEDVVGRSQADASRGAGGGGHHRAVAVVEPGGVGADGGACREAALEVLIETARGAHDEVLASVDGRAGHGGQAQEIQREISGIAIAERLQGGVVVRATGARVEAHAGVQRIEVGANRNVATPDENGDGVVEGVGGTTVAGARAAVVRGYDDDGIAVEHPVALDQGQDVADVIVDILDGVVPGGAAPARAVSGVVGVPVVDPGVVEAARRHVG